MNNTKFGAFMLLLIGTIGLLANEFIFENTGLTLLFAVANAVGFAILGFVYWSKK